MLRYARYVSYAAMAAMLSYARTNRRSLCNFVVFVRNVLLFVHSHCMRERTYERMYVKTPPYDMHASIINHAPRTYFMPFTKTRFSFRSFRGGVYYTHLILHAMP